MPSSHPIVPVWRRAGAVAVWLAVAGLLAWLTVACLVGDVEHRLTAPQRRGSGKVAHAVLPAPPRPWPADLRVDVLEDGVRLETKGRYPRTVVRDDGEGSERFLVVYFMASDRTDPHRNGRSYALRYPRSRLPAALLLLLAGWIVLPVTAWRLTSTPARAPASWWPGWSAVAWTPVICGALYSLFALQAWLPPSNLPWFVVVAAAAAPAFLARWPDALRPLPPWAPWLVGLLAWAGCTVVAGGAYAVGATARGVVLACVWGAVVTIALRRSLADDDGQGDRRLLALFVFAAVLSLARDAGFHPAAFLSTLSVGAGSSRDVVNPWTTKFLGHWLVVLGWCTVTALTRRQDRRVDLVLVAVLGLTAVTANGSRSAVAMLLVAVLVTAGAVRWPRALRRVVVACLAVGVLLAPFLAALPWRARLALPAGEDAGGWGAIDVRSANWEYSRRLIAEHPLVGWGLGASARLPGRGTPIPEALGLDAQRAGPRLARKTVLPGGHPHNVVLLIWLDLGLVGALLVAGLFVAAGRTLAAVQSDRKLHAGLLGLLASTVLLLTFNYPLWEPEVLSILWMTLALAGGVSPWLTTAHPAPRRDGAA